MLGQLTLRELKDNSFFKTKGSKRWISAVVSFIVLALFISIEVYVYANIFDKVNVFDKFNDSLLIIIIFSMMILGIIGLIPFVIKTFFGNDKEKIILGTSPISIYDIIIAKGVKVLLHGCLFALSSSFVIACVYGYKCELDFIYYIVMFLTSLFMGLFMSGLAFIFAIPCHALMIVVKRYKVLTIIVTIVIALLIAFAYGGVLTMFINLIRDANLDKIFTSSSVKTMSDVAKYLYPVTFMVNHALNVDMAINFIGSFLMVAGFSFIGFFAMRFYLAKFYNSSLDINRKYKDRMINIRITRPSYALVKKELSLALSNSDGIFSYLILVILEPFLIYGVVSAINLIFNTGNLNYISSLYPAIYISLDVVLILMFISVINMTSSLTLSKEKDTLTVMKTMPISFKKQLLIKISVFFMISALSFIATILALAIGKEISWTTFGFLLVIGLSSILILNLMSLFNDLNMKDKSNILSLFMGFILPIIVVALAGLATIFIPNDFDEISFLSIILGINIIVLVLMIILFDKKISYMFIKYEGVNK